MSDETADVHHFDPRSVDSMGVWRSGLNPSAGDRVMSLIVPLHFGTFAARESGGA